MQDEGAFGPILESNNIPFYTLNMDKEFKESFKGFLKLIKLLKQESPDILQTWLYHADLVGTFAGLLAGIKSIIWNIRCSNMDLSHYSIKTRLVIKLCALFSFIPKYIIANSDKGRIIHQALGYCKKSFRFIPNGFDAKIYQSDPNERLKAREAFQVEEGTFVVGMIARFDKMKDHKTFLQAAGILKNEFPNICFVLAGSEIDAANQELMTEAETQALNNTLHLLGPRQDIPFVMQALDVLVLSSSFGEGFPNVLAEAMLCEIPPVSTDVGDAALVVSDFGCIVPPEDPEALAKGVSTFLTMDPTKRRELGKMARAHIIENFSLEKMISRYEALYSTAFKGPEYAQSD